MPAGHILLCMNSTPIYHEASEDSAEAILREGLKYGAQGEGSREEHARKTNEALNRRRPQEYAEAGLDRQACLYGFLFLEGKIIDVRDGRQLEPAEWQPEEGKAGFKLTVDPEKTYVSDLDAYDALAEAAEQGRDGELDTLADGYWERLRRLDEVLQNFALDMSGTGIAGRNSNDRFARVEVVLTQDVPPERIERLGG